MQAVNISHSGGQGRSLNEQYVYLGLKNTSGRLANSCQAKDFGTGMPDEQHYESHLMSIEEAMKRVWGQEVPVLQYVWACYQETLAWEGRSSKAGTSQSENLPLA